MRGPILQLGPGHYLVRISAGRDPVAGKRGQASRTIHGSKQDPKLALAELRVEHSRRLTPLSDTTLDVLVDQFLSSPTRSRSPRGPGSRYRERCRYQRHVQPGIGDRVAGGINPPPLLGLVATVADRDGLARDATNLRREVPPRPRHLLIHRRLVFSRRSSRELDLADSTDDEPW